MRIHRDQPIVRTCGTLLGLGFVSIGAYAMFGAGDEVGAVVRDRAFWFGVTAVIGGVCAIGCSLLVEKLDDIWCRQPRRWQKKHTRGD